MKPIYEDNKEARLRLLDWDTGNRYLVVMSGIDGNKDNSLKDSILKDSILYDGNNQDVAKAVFDREYKYMKCIVLYSYSIYGVYTMLAIKES